jgi:hypothetical protein
MALFCARRAAHPAGFAGFKATVDSLPRLWQTILRRDVHQDERALALSIAPSPTAFRSGMVTASNIHTSETLASCSKNAPIRRTASDHIDKLAA